MFAIKNEVCFLKICSQYAKRKINNTVRVCSSRLFGTCLTPHYCVVRFASQLTLLPTPYGEIAPYFGLAENSNLTGKKQSVMLKFVVRKS